MAGIHQTLKEARSLYAEALKLQEAVLASHRDLKGCVAQVQTWHESAGSLMAQVETLTVRLKNRRRGRETSGSETGTVLSETNVRLARR